MSYKENETDCEYSYYIDNYYRCILTGQVCRMHIPDQTQCTVYDVEKEKRRTQTCKRTKKTDWSTR